MTTYDFTKSGGFPLTQDILAEMQNIGSAGAFVGSFIFGETVIVTGLEDNGSGGYTPGLLFAPIFGFVRCEGSADAAAGNRIKYVQTKKDLVYYSGASLPSVTETSAQITAETAMTVAVSDLKRIENILTLKAAQQEISQLKEETAQEFNSQTLETIESGCDIKIITLRKNVCSVSISGTNQSTLFFNTSYSVMWDAVFGKHSFPVQDFYAPYTVWEITLTSQNFIASGFARIRLGDLNSGADSKNFRIEIPATLLNENNRVSISTNFIIKIED